MILILAGRLQILGRHRDRFFERQLGTLIGGESTNRKTAGQQESENRFHQVCQALRLTQFRSSKLVSNRFVAAASAAESHARGSYCFLFGESGPVGLPICPCR